MTDVIFDVYDEHGYYVLSTTDREEAEYNVQLYGGYYNTNEEEQKCQLQLIVQPMK